MDTNKEKITAELEFLSRYFKRQGLNGLDIVELSFNIIANIILEIDDHDEQIREMFHNACEVLIEFKKEQHEQSDKPSSSSDNAG